MNELSIRAAALLLFFVAGVASASCAWAVCADPPGDVTGDSATTIVDVQCLILDSLAAIGSTTGAQPACVSGPPGVTDLNCDSGADVSDVVLVVGLVLGVDMGPLLDFDGDSCIDSCEDVACTVGTASPTPLDCDDGNSFTFDTCVPGPGCVSVAAESRCRPDDAGACGGRGTCLRNKGGQHFTCACPAGWAGEHCDACASGWHPVSDLGAGAMDSAAALDPVDTATTGPAAVLACAPDESCGGDTCSGHGRCEDQAGEALCLCELGYEGSECERCAPGFDASTGGGTAGGGTAGSAEDLVCARGATCRVQECGNRGNCVDIDGVQFCLCDTGFDGDRCESCAAGFHDNGKTCVLDQSCATDTCSGHGTCFDKGGEAKCECDAGFGGPDCSQTCASNSCSGAGQCVVDGDGARCECVHPDLDASTDCAACAPGLQLVMDPTGGPQCVLEAPCTETSTETTCQGHGECALDPANGAVACECDNLWTGPSCARCPSGMFAVDDRCVPAAECAEILCHSRGVCTGDALSPSCLCDTGTDGAFCEADLPIAAYRVEGVNEVLEPGETRILRAEVLGVGDHGELVWTLESGAGTLTPLGAGEALYAAPSAPPDGIDVVQIKVALKCCPSSGAGLGLTWKAATMPWVTGVTKAAFKAVDSRLMNFMYDRCTGGAVLGLNWKGIPIFRRGYGRDSGRSTPGRPGVSCGPVHPDAKPVWPDSPVRIGSNSKPINAAMVRKSTEARLLAYGRLPDEDDFASTQSWRAAVDLAVEDVRILDQDLNLLPVNFRQRAGNCVWTGNSVNDTNSYSCTDGTLPPPMLVPISDNSPPSSCSGTACFNGGSCQINGGGNAVCSCPSGFSGSRCRILSSGSNLSGLGVDRRWQQITLGMLFTHESGLPNGVVSQDDLLDNLEAVRKVHDPSWKLVDDIGPLLHEFSYGYADPGPGAPVRRVLLNRPSTYEFVLAQIGRSLDYNPGATSVYSNLGFVLLQTIAEYTAVKPGWSYGGVWSGDTNEHEEHVGSRLDGFVRVYLGGWPGDTNMWGATRSRYGMFLARSPATTVPSPAQLDPYELEPREWLSGTWNPDQDDRKGLVCLLEGGQCTWESGIVDHFGNPGQVKFGYHGNLMSAGAGGVVTESGAYLRFMQKFTVGYSSTFPGYGRPRVGFAQSSSHNGEWVGARSTVRQVGWRTQGSKGACTHAKTMCNPGDELANCCPPGGTCCGANFDCVTNGWVSGPVNSANTANNECVRVSTYFIPNVTQSTGDYVSTTQNPSKTGGCVLPEGLDIFVTANQSSDSQDVGGKDYDFLDDAVLRGLCAVQWPPNPYLLGPNTNQVQVMSP